MTSMSDDAPTETAPEPSGPPDRRLIELLAADQSLPLDRDQLDVAWRVQVMHRPELERLRGVELDYVPSYVEPATALRWIENGGFHA
jgi:hypothetical protein